MSTKNPQLKAGMAAIGLLWTSASIAGAQEAAPAPLPMPVKAPTNAPTFAVLLLSNGREIPGDISEDKAGTHYLIHHKGGTIPVPRANVERRFGSIAELYQYKVSQLPEGDPDPQMKLARWCIEKSMYAEARVHLKALLEINPKDVTAERMVASIDTSMQRMADGLDRAVQVTGATVVDGAPRELSPSALPRPRGALGRAIGQPVIFDLPPAVASKRAREFGQYVHPILQGACASCHNGNYQGDFRLIPGSRREWTDELIRANLDTSLRRVNRDDPVRSDLLGYAVNPHGSNPRPIFTGPNDPRYQTLRFWLNSLKPPEGTAKSGPTDVNEMRGSVPVASGEQFGAERSLGAQASTRPTSPTIPPLPPGVPEGKRKVESYQMEATDPRVPPNANFAMPTLPSGPGMPPRPLPLNPTSPTLMALPALPPGVTLGPDGTAVPAGTVMPPPDDVIPPTNRAKKKAAVDRSLLEKMLKARQSGETPQP